MIDRTKNKDVALGCRIFETDNNAEAGYISRVIFQQRTRSRGVMVSDTDALNIG
jgi:hypothetical protein